MITGASTGFGRSASETLAHRGYTVFAAMRDTAERNASHREALESLAKGEGLRLEVVDLDVTQDASVNEAIEEVMARAGRIDAQVNG